MGMFLSLILKLVGGWILWRCQLRDEAGDVAWREELPGGAYLRFSQHA